MRRTSASPVESNLSATATSLEAEFEYVYRTFRRMGSPPAEAEDLAQDVFVVMCRRWRDFQADRPLRPWLAGIAYRVARDHSRKYSRRELAASGLHAEAEAPGLDDQLSSARARHLALQALATLPERYRAVLVRHHVDGLSIRQMAEETSTPFFTVAARLRRARRRFTRAVKQLQLGGRRLAVIVGLTAAAAGIVVALVPRGATRHRTAAVSPALAAGRPAPAPPARGLVGRWSFDDGPGSAMARDSSGNGHPCLLRDLDEKTAWVSGPLGGALDLGRSGWLECPLPPTRAGGPIELSMALWIKRVANRRPETAFFSRQFTGAEDLRNQLFWFGLHDHSLLLRSWAWTGWTSRSLPPPETWTHVAAVHGARDTRLYVDGVLVRQTTNHQPRAEGVVDSPLTIGGMRFSDDPLRVRHHFDGLLDEAVLYDRALEDAEVAALARAR